MTEASFSKLPCPFCGWEIIWVMESPNAYCTCDECKAEGPIGTTEESAVELWNRRVNQAIKSE